MKQPSKNIKTSSVNNKPKKKTKKKPKRTICNNISGLEVFFQNEILNKIGVEYQSQFLLNYRFYDFYLPNENILLEIDGDFFHSNPKFYNLNNLYKTQKRNRRIDKIKNESAFKMKYHLIRIWEYDIKNNTEKIIEELQKLFIELKERKSTKPIQKTLLFD